MTVYTDLSYQDFVTILASKAPTPGGGGASALVGAIGMALGNMVVSLTVGKKKYAAVEAEILGIQAEAAQLQVDLLALVEADAAVFRPLAQAYSLPGNTQEEQAYKAEQLSQYCQAAAEVPLAIMEKCYQALLLARRVAEIGSKIAVSDAGCAAYFLAAAVGAARLNVLINLPLIQDKDLAGEKLAQADRMLADARRLSDETLAVVESWL